jgi:hypothetical protein
MDDHAAPDIVNGDRYSVKDLRAAVFEGKGELSRPLALSLLRGKKYPQKVRDLERLLTNEKEEPRIRSTAAQLLGEMRTPEAMRALNRGLDTREVLTLRGVVQGLASAGGSDAIPALRRLARRKGPVGDAAKRAVTMLSHRMPAGGRAPNGPDPPGERSKGRKPPPPRSSLHTQSIADEEVERALEGVARAVPNIQLAAEGAIAVRRDDKTFTFLPNREVVADVTSLARGPMQLGLVAVARREGSGWEPKHHILTEPAGEGRVTITVLTSGGRPLLAGSGRVIGREIEFEVASVERQGGTRVRVRGSYDGRSVRIEDADVELRAMTSAPSPARRVRAV